MFKTKQIKLWFILVALVVLVYPGQLGIEFVARKIINKELTKFIQKHYKEDLEFAMERLEISFVELLRLKLNFQSENLKLADMLQVESLSASVDLWSWFRTKKIYIKGLSVDGAKLVIDNDSIDQRFALEQMKIQINDLILGASHDQAAARYSIKNNLIDLKGSLKISGPQQYYSVEGGGQIQDLDIKQLLLVINGKKPGLAGSLKLENLQFKSFGASPQELSANLKATADLAVKDGTLYLLDYIVQTKRVVNSVLPIGKVLDVFEVVSLENLAASNKAQEKYKDSLNSDNSKFTSFIAKLKIEEEKIFLDDLEIDTPIMNVAGSGRSSFDQKLMYRVDVSLAGLPILPIMITGKAKLPLVLIDLEGYPRRRVKSLLKLLR